MRVIKVDDEKKLLGLNTRINFVSKFFQNLKINGTPNRINAILKNVNKRSYQAQLRTKELVTIEANYYVFQLNGNIKNNSNQFIISPRILQIYLDKQEITIL